VATHSQFYPPGSSARAQGKPLAEACVQDWEEFAQAYSHSAPQLFRYFWVHTRSRTLAEDLVSETFLAALEALPTYRARRGSLSTWLFGIGRRALGRCLKEQAQVVLADVHDLAATPVEPACPPPEERIDLWQAVSELSSSEREIIALKFGAGLAHREIAEVTGLREAHVGVVVYRALQKLRDRLSGGIATNAR
jgi:RNA polymerase sigma-70 factor (ECF subfamily)